MSTNAKSDPPQLPSGTRLLQRHRTEGGVALVEETKLIRAADARELYKINGSRCSVAFLDTGIYAKHVDFAGKTVQQWDFTGVDQVPVPGASDTDGHGTSVAGIIAADGDHVGIAPGAHLIALKVFSSAPRSWKPVISALRWVSDHAVVSHICAVNMSFGDERVWASSAGLAKVAEKDDYLLVENLVNQLEQQKVPVVVSAGNNYYATQKEGMSFPAITNSVISVGAVYGYRVLPYTFDTGAQSYQVTPDVIAPFSERLMAIRGQTGATTIFAPGTFVKTSGILDPHGDAFAVGTSDAAPIVTGVAVLIREFYEEKTHSCGGPKVSDIKAWMRSAPRLVDKASGQDNVRHTGKAYLRIDAVCSLAAEAAALANPPTSLPACGAD